MGDILQDHATKIYILSEKMFNNKLQIHSLRRVNAIIWDFDIELQNPMPYYVPEECPEDKIGTRRALEIIQGK